VLKQNAPSTARERLTEAVSTAPQRPRSRLIYWLIALALAAVLLYFSLRGIEWSAVWQTLARADLGLIALSSGIVTLGLFMRAVRWRVLLQAQGRVDVAIAFWATSAGYFGNNFLPARAGELVRTMMVSARCGLGKMFVLTTALSERMCDAITLVVISSVVLLTLPVRPGWFDRAAKPFAILGLSGVICIAVLPKLEGALRHLIGLLPGSGALKEKLRHAMEQILIGIRSFHDAGRLTRFLSLTMVIWLNDALAVIVSMRALGMNVSWGIALLLTAGLGLGSALPSTPGYVGIYQFVAVSVLTPFGFSRTNAIAYILLGQALQYVVIGFWGVIGFARSRRLAQSAAAT
jgi:glycosyltransferase 2 family protein